MQHRFTPTTFFIWSGLLAWAADFLFVYCFAAVACARGFAHREIFGVAVVPLAAMLATVLALAATAVIMRRALRRMRAASEETRFIDFLALALAALAVIAIVWNALPALLLSTQC